MDDFVFLVVGVNFFFFFKSFVRVFQAFVFEFAVVVVLFVLFFFVFFLLRSTW